MRGATCVTATGSVSGGDIGINALNSAAATDLTVCTAGATGGVYGIFVGNEGSGSTKRDGDGRRR